MKIFTCTDHKGLWPVGVASVVVARDKYEARTLLDAELVARKLEVTPYVLKELDTETPAAHVLHDGGY